MQSPSNASSETAGNATEPGDTGDGSVDNVAACESFAESIECSLPEGILECSAYADVDCDITDYLDCLTDNTSCANGVIDTSGWIECFSLVEDCL